MTEPNNMVARILGGSRDDTVHLALAYIQGRVLEAGNRTERSLRKRARERSEDLAACLKAMVVELEKQIAALETAP